MNERDDESISAYGYENDEALSDSEQRRDQRFSRWLPETEDSDDGDMSEEEVLEAFFS